MNSHEFAADFGCKLDSPMNPKTKCSVWTTPALAKDHSSTKHEKKHSIIKQIDAKEHASLKNQTVIYPKHALPSFIRKLIGPIG